LYYGIAKFDFIFPFVFLIVPLLATSQNSEKKGKKKHWLWVGFVVARKNEEEEDDDDDDDDVVVSF
jgi:hypothetical protein